MPKNPLSNRIVSSLVVLGGFFLVFGALIGDGASSLVAGISVGRGGGSSSTTQTGQNGSVRASVWKGFMTAMNADELVNSTQQAQEAGVEVSVVRA